MDNMQDLKNLTEKTFIQKNIWVSCGNVLIQVYQNRVLGGGVQFNIRYGTQYDEAELKFEERRLGVFAVGSASRNNHSIDYTKTRDFKMNRPIKDLLEAFCDCPCIDSIVNDLLAYKEL